MLKDLAFVFILFIPILSSVAQPTNELSILFGQANDLSHTDIDSSTEIFQTVYELAIGLDSMQRAGLAQYSIGINLMDKGDFDTAMSHFDLAEEIFRDLDDFHGLTLINVTRGNIFNFRGEIQEAIQFYHTALDFASLDQDTFSQARILNNLGAAYNSSGRLQQSLNTLLQAEPLAFAIDNPIILGDLNNNLASNYEALKRIDKAIFHGKRAIDYYHQAGDYEYEALAHTNLAAYLLVADSLEVDSIAYYLEAGKQILDSIYSPSILTNYYKQLTHYYSKIGKNREAKIAADSCLNLLAQFPNRQGESQIYERLFHIYKSENNPAKALEYHEKFMAVRDSMVYDESNRQLQELEARYQSATKDALLAKQELQITQRTSQRNLYLTLAILLFGFGAFLFYRHRQKELFMKDQVALQKQQIENLEKQQQIVALDHLLQGQEEERKRIAQDLHDGLGGLLSTVQVKVNNVLRSSSGGENEASLLQSANMISDACQEVRRIAHDMMPGALIKIGLFAAVSDLIDTYSESTIINFHFEVPDEECLLPDNAAISTYRIIQEIINNLIKYSDANNFYLSIDIVDDALHILAHDDGVGFDMDNADFSPGLGLEGIRSRVQHLNGVCDIFSKPGKGVRYQISIPRTK